MPIYHRLGKIPPKRHTQFEKPTGGLYYEQLFGTIGFDGMSSLSYHIYRPTMIKEILSSVDVAPKIAVEKNSTIIFPLPIDIMKVFMDRQSPVRTDHGSVPSNPPIPEEPLAQ